MEIEEIEELVRAAVKAKEKAYCPYSKFRVGAAVKASSGRIYTGCNVENASYGLTVCAERVAIFKAVSEGEREVLAVAVATDLDEFVFPCGACRQVILEFGANAKVISAKPSGEYVVKNIKELLPNSFTREKLGV